MPKIWIDPGHGGIDPGAIGPENRLEKNDNLRYACALRDLLSARGVDCVLTRVSDKELSPRKSIDYARRTALEYGCNLAISCHRNAGPPSATGAEIWIHSRAAASTLAWASDTISGFAAADFPIRFGQHGARGVYKGYPGFPNDDFYCNSSTRSPSLLVELGFITSPSDNARFDRSLPSLVRAIADAACRKLSVPF